VPHRSDAQELAVAARAIIDGNRYLTLATADADGLPWASPVWFATLDYREFFWVSKPGARHSRNLAARPQVAIVIFDSRAPGGAGRGVYMSAVAEEVPDGEVERGIAVFSRRSEEQGLPSWTSSELRPPARHRLYRATAAEHFVLDARDERLPVRLDA
jgi:pyridoxine/pyridoxamine 5'-phosphate oxidase